MTALPLHYVYLETLLNNECPGVATRREQVPLSWRGHVAGAWWAESPPLKDNVHA